MTVTSQQDPASAFCLRKAHKTFVSSKNVLILDESGIRVDMEFSSVILGHVRGGSSGNISESDQPLPEFPGDWTAAQLRNVVRSNYIPGDERPADFDIQDSSDSAASQQGRITFLNVLDLLRQYSVPSVDLRHPAGTTLSLDGESVSAEKEADRGNIIPRHYNHALGGGYSAIVIRHLTTDDVHEVNSDHDNLMNKEPALVTPSGTVVAFKKISPRPSTQGATEVALDSEAFRTICREIEVCRHPLLLKHENICKVLYVVWTLNETLPWIALELAMYGTLEDVLTAPGEGPTFKQKLNLTIDIALGLAALHHTGVVHGDLKPANILVNGHPTRQIVGQLSDFGGSAKIGETDPSIATPIWLAPEACISCPCIDWRLADTWSYGLVVASIWSRDKEIRKATSSCYLEHLLSEDLEPQMRDARILLLKIALDSSPDSILFRLDTFPSCVAPILSMALSCQSTNRKPVQALVDQDLGLCFAILGRERQIDYSHSPVPKALPFKVWSHGYRSRTDTYKQIVYQQFVKASSSLLIAMFSEEGLLEDLFQQNPDHVEYHRDQHLPVSSQLWIQYANKALSIVIVNRLRVDREAIIAFQVAMSNCCELGAESNEAEFMAWVYAAAKGGHNNALWMLPLLEESCITSYGNGQFLKACLVVGSCIGSVSCLIVLERIDRDLYESTLAAIRSRERPDLETGIPETTEAFKRFLDAPCLSLSTCSLVDALGSHNDKRARSILEASVTDVTAMVDEHGRNILHKLTYLRDKDTEGLALLAYVQGAALQQVAASTQTTTHLLYYQQIGGTPICWATLNNMPCLVKQLLELHEDTATVIEDFLRMSFAAAQLHQYEVLQLIISQFERTPELMIDQNSSQDKQWLMQALLGAALTSAGTLPFARRIVHGKGFDKARSDTLRMLLSEGADPLLPGAGFVDYTFQKFAMCPVDLAIANKDEDSLELLLAKIRDSTDQYEVQDVMHGKLVVCLMRNSLKCLRVVLDIFPQLVNPPVTNSGSSPTLTPLNLAADNPIPEYALALLKAGADVTVCYKGFSPLARALVGGHLATAEVIFKYCSNIDIERTFSYNENTGVSMSGRLMSTWHTGQKGRSRVDAMKWLHEKGGAYFDHHVSGSLPVWGTILFYRASSSTEQASLDNLMLTTLFDMFPDKIDVADEDGLFPIHRATINGHHRAVELLLDRCVDIDAETVGRSDASEVTFPEGRTALSLAVERAARKAPHDILSGGRYEIKRWRATMKGIVELLSSRGGTFGKHPSGIDYWHSLEQDFSLITVSTLDESYEDDELQWGEDVWPKRVPNNGDSPQGQEWRGTSSNPKLRSADRSGFAQDTFLRRYPQHPMGDEEKETFARYKKWLLEKTRLRVDLYRRHSFEWNTVGQNEQVGDSSPWFSDWERWHSLSSVQTACSPDVGGMAENDTCQVSRKNMLVLPYS
ncbi:unnamed protein product [Alternaria alternata]